VADRWHFIALSIVQIVGAIFGALLVSGLMPKTHIGMGDGAPGDPTKHPVSTSPVPITPSSKTL
jgi:glycerol uptake facilitator-like aquaporin